jgi:hemoglobin
LIVETFLELDMKHFFRLAYVIVFTSFCLSIAFAQNASVQTNKDDSLYVALGQKAGIAQLSDDFVTRLVANPRMRPFFEKTNLPHFKLQLADQFCVVSGGPCVYKGADMKSSHANFDITAADFNALVEVLQQSMDAKGIPFRAQNRLLALLAPMHREVITVK